MRIHISYSDRIFHPFKDCSKFKWHLTNENARHMWEVLSKQYSDVSYGDIVPNEQLDILWTNRNIKRPSNVKRMGYMASVAHHSYVHYQVKKYLSEASKLPEGLASVKERWEYYLTLSNADLIFYAGNQKIFNSFKKFPHPYKTIFLRFDWGLDLSYFRAITQKSSFTFLYNCNTFSIRKGSHIVSKAWRLFSKQHPEAQLIMMARDGDFDISRVIENNSNIQLIHDNIPRGSLGEKKYLESLSQAKWVILPSLAEGQAGSLLEAMSCGCVPIASFDTGINANEYHGYVVEPNNSSNLANIMEQAIHEWNPNLPLLVREKIKQNHKWSDFEENILKATEYLAALPLQSRKNNMKSALWFFWFDLLRVFYRSF